MTPTLDTLLRTVTESSGDPDSLGGAAPADWSGWIRCADVDLDWYRRWESQTQRWMTAEHGRADITATAALPLIWYASIPGRLGGAAFRHGRRVPRLGREHIAFRLISEAEPFVERQTLLDPRFWCLPDDPAADDPHATVVADTDALAERLRHEIAAHADDFLREITPGAKLPRRALRGAFRDGLAVGIWIAGDQSIRAEAEIVRDIALALPSDADSLGDAANIRCVTDSHGDKHLNLTRMCCCYLYRVVDDARPCATCPRATDNELPTLLARHRDH